MKLIRIAIVTTIAISSLLLTKVFVGAAEEMEFKINRFTEDKAKQEVTQMIFFREKRPEIGKVIGAYRRNQKLSNEDTLYLRFKDTLVSVGDVFTIYEDLGGVKRIGSLFKKVGQKIMVKGFVQITSVLPETTVGKIFDATSDINIGDLIGPNMEISHKLNPQEPLSDIRGRILSNSTENELIGSFEFVFLDKGASDNLRKDDRLFVYRTADGNQEVTKGLPEVAIAELVVVSTEPKFSTAYVLSASDSFERGAFFKAARSQVRFLEQNPESAPVGQSNSAPQAQ